MLSRSCRSAVKHKARRHFATGSISVQGMAKSRRGVDHNAHKSKVSLSVASKTQLQIQQKWRFPSG
jgi:hypothetical protein